MTTLSKLDDYCLARVLSFLSAKDLFSCARINHGRLHRRAMAILCSMPSFTVEPDISGNRFCVFTPIVVKDVDGTVMAKLRCIEDFGKSQICANTTRAVVPIDLFGDAVLRRWLHLLLVLPKVDSIVLSFFGENPVRYRLQSQINLDAPQAVLPFACNRFHDDANARALHMFCEQSADLFTRLQSLAIRNIPLSVTFQNEFVQMLTRRPPTCLQSLNIPAFLLQPFFHKLPAIANRLKELSVSCDSHYQFVFILCCVASAGCSELEHFSYACHGKHDAPFDDEEPRIRNVNPPPHNSLPKLRKMSLVLHCDLATPIVFQRVGHRCLNIEELHVTLGSDFGSLDMSFHGLSIVRVTLTDRDWDSFPLHKFLDSLQSARQLQQLAIEASALVAPLYRQWQFAPLLGFLQATNTLQSLQVSGLPFYFATPESTAGFQPSALLNVLQSSPSLRVARICATTSLLCDEVMSSVGKQYKVECAKDASNYLKNLHISNNPGAMKTFQLYVDFLPFNTVRGINA